MLSYYQKWRSLKTTLSHFPRYMTEDMFPLLTHVNIWFISWFSCFVQNGRASLGDSIYKSITVEFFDPEQLLSTTDLSTEHKVLEFKNRIEASIVIWKRKMNHKDGKSTWGSAISLEKRELFEERAETILLLLKQRFPGLPQSQLEISKIQFNQVKMKDK